MSNEDKIRMYGSVKAYEKFMAEKYLKDTDYVIIKIQEYQITGQQVDNDYTETLQKREEARNILRSLEV